MPYEAFLFVANEGKIRRRYDEEQLFWRRLVVWKRP